MANLWENLAAACSVVLRLSAYIFLQWIPGHHFPPIIISAISIYISIIYLRRDCFGSHRLSLDEAFPAVNKSQTPNIDSNEHASQSVIVDLIHDDPVLYQDEHPFFRTLLLGIPDWTEWLFSSITIAVNILLVCMTLDFVYRGPLFHPELNLRFSRLGFIDEQSAKVLVREPDAGQLPIYVYYKKQDDMDWSATSQIYYTGPETDFTQSLTFTNLDPDTKYMYSLSNNLTGYFQTAPAPNTANAQSLTFLTSSCIKANFPYRPFDHSLSIHGFEHLSKLVRLLSSPPAFMMFLGDFIYIDVPQRLSSTFAHYRSEYRRVYASPSWKLRGLDGLPWLHTLDDHEIANDWAGGNETAPFPAASDPFIHYHVSVNPPVPLSSAQQPVANTTYFEFTRGPASFFMLDTRRYRTSPEQSETKVTSAKPFYGSSQSSSKPPSSKEMPASMLGREQLQALLAFLQKPERPGVYWKFVASSVPFTRNWRFGTSDTWGGFLTERQQILAAMHQAEARLGVRVVVLSGDRHEFAAIRYTPALAHVDYVSSPGKDGGKDLTLYDPTPQVGPHEFSVGPLSQFYLPIRTFRQIDEQDIAIKYLPDGNSKVGVVEIHNLVGAEEHVPTWMDKWLGKSRRGNEQQSLMKYSLWIDGKVAWEYTIISPSPKFDLAAKANSIV